MSITNKGSVLILGAGVSASFGMPLGDNLIEQIARAIESERGRIFGFKDDYGGHQKRYLVKEAVHNADAFIQLPIHGAVARKHIQPKAEANWDAISEDFKRLESLLALLSDQTSETIDDFIVENPGHADLTKIAIASLLLRNSYKIQGAHHSKFWAPCTFEARRFGPSGTRNWIHLLINVIRHGIRKGEVSSENKVQIVTFNYDRILEHVLESQFSNTEARHPHYSNFVDIYHVHGAFGELRSNKLDFSRMALEWAAGLHVVNEKTVPQEVTEARERARLLIAEAREVYSAGFSFAGPNCKLIGLTDWSVPNTGKRYLRYCNYDGNVGVKRSAESIKRGLAKIVVEEAAGSIDRPLGVNDWIKAGHLGELPG